MPNAKFYNIFISYNYNTCSKFSNKSNEIKKFSKKLNIIELINNDKISKDYFFKKISIKEGQSFWKFNPFKLKKDLENFNEIKNFTFYLNWSGILKSKLMKQNHL